MRLLGIGGEGIERRETPVPASALSGVIAMRLESDGTATISLRDGTVHSERLESFAGKSSCIAETTYYPGSYRMHLRTKHGDSLLVEIPRPDNPAPLKGRASIYLDQNHWSTLTNSVLNLKG